MITIIALDVDKTVKHVHLRIYANHVLIILT